LIIRVFSWFYLSLCDPVLRARRREVLQRRKNVLKTDAEREKTH